FVCVRWPRHGRLRRCLIPRYEPISISRLMSSPTLLRRSPSTRPSWLITLVMRRTSSSLRSLTFTLCLTFAFPRIVTARERPIPKMYVRPISTRLLGGRSTPAIRATSRLLSALALLVLRVLAHYPHDTLALHDLALVADLLDRRPNL